MLNLPASTKIFLCRKPVDFRKAHNGLFAIVRDQLAENIFEGGLFVFLNKRRNGVKILEWDGNGLWLHYKRLEKGTFSWLPQSAEIKVSMTRAELSMLLEGIDLKAGKYRRYFADDLGIDGRATRGIKERVSTGPKVLDRAFGRTRSSY
jgi:transposase